MRLQAPAPSPPPAGVVIEKQWVKVNEHKWAKLSSTTSMRNTLVGTARKDLESSGFAFFSMPDVDAEYWFNVYSATP